MATIKKTISLPEELYKEAESISNNFSEIVKEALSDYLKRKKNRESFINCRSHERL